MKRIATTLAVAALASFASQATLQLPFSETFDSLQGTEVTSDHQWEYSTTSTLSYPPKWRYAGFFWIDSRQVMPMAGEGGLAFISTYDYTPEADFSITSEPIETDGPSTLEFSFQYYVPEGIAGTTSVEASISFDQGETFSPLHYALFAEETKGWNSATTTIDNPWGAYEALLRITAHNSAEALPVAVDNIRLRKAETPASIYPSSVSDFTASLRADMSAIDLSLRAPVLTHPSLGDVNSQPIESLSKIVVLRQIGYGNDYLPVHEFTNPEPGTLLEYADTDLTTGGEYYYKAVTYIGQNCDYGEYLDRPITVGQIPGDVTALLGASNRGAAPVTLTFTLPSTDLNGKPLAAIQAVIVSKYDNDEFIWAEAGRLTEGLAPGQQASWTDPNVVTNEIYEYRVAVQGSAGTSYGTACTVFVGADQPVRPTDLVASLGEDGLVHLTWTAPTQGENGGWIDTENLTYVVQRGNGYSDYDADLLKSGIKECSYTDPTGFAEEEIVKYFVKAVSNGIDGFSAISNPLVVGDPSELPFVENFNKEVGGYIQPHHSSWTTSSTEPSSDWAFAEMAYFINEGQAMPVGTDGGLAYVYYGHYSSLHRTDWLTSGRMNVENAQPILSFWLHPYRGYDTKLDVETSFDGGSFQTLKGIDYNSDVKTDGWQQYILPIEVPAGAATMQIRFAASKGDYACSVAIDNVRVDNDSSAVKAVEGIDAEVSATNGVITISGLQDTDSVGIYTPAGVKVFAAEGNCSAQLPEGLYLVVLPTRTLKVTI